jgi:hypothetical protein
MEGRAAVAMVPLLYRGLVAVAAAAGLVVQRELAEMVMPDRLSFPGHVLFTALQVLQLHQYAPGKFQRLPFHQRLLDYR